MTFIKLKLIGRTTNYRLIYMSIITHNDLIKSSIFWVSGSFIIAFSYAWAIL
jgi:hypothetical protein